MELRYIIVIAFASLISGVFTWATHKNMIHIYSKDSLKDIWAYHEQLAAKRLAEQQAQKAAQEKQMQDHIQALVNQQRGKRA